MLFRSAGFLEAGRRCPDLLVQTLAEWEIDVTRHQSYQLDTASLGAADLVLTMEGEHVRNATLLDRTSFTKIMPLKEAADRLRRSGPLELESFVEMVNRERDPTSYLSSRWDVDDPYNRKLKDYRRVVAELAELVDVVVSGLN